MKSSALWQHRLSPNRNRGKLPLLDSWQKGDWQGTVWEMLKEKPTSRGQDPAHLWMFVLGRLGKRQKRHPDWKERGIFLAADMFLHVQKSTRTYQRDLGMAWRWLGGQRCWLPARGPECAPTWGTRKTGSYQLPSDPHTTPTLSHTQSK